MKTCQNGATLGRIAAKRRSEQWSNMLEENHQKLTFREGLQPWDLASFSRRIKSYRFIMESSKSKPYSANLKFMHALKLAVALSTSWPGGATRKSSPGARSSPTRGHPHARGHPRREVISTREGIPSVEIIMLT